MKKPRQNKAEIKVYFEDGASLTWSIRPDGPAAKSRDVLADKLVEFATSIRSGPPVDPARQEPGR